MILKAPAIMPENIGSPFYIFNYMLPKLTLCEIKKLIELTHMIFKCTLSRLIPKKIYEHN